MFKEIMYKKTMRERWENVYLKDMNVHYSRIIASWINAGGKTFGKEFKDWLMSVDALTEDQIDDICRLATNGKLEWEYSAKEFLKSLKK